MAHQTLHRPFSHKFAVARAGLVAVILRARCRSKNQTSGKTDENLRVEINGLRFREIPPEKYVQLFNIPAACNGAELKGLLKTTVFFTILEQGEHILNLIPQPSATIEHIEVREFNGGEPIILDREEQAEDGNRRPWYTFVFVGLPVKYFSAEITAEKRIRDSDDVKIIIDGVIKKASVRGKFSFWYIIGELLPWIVRGVRGTARRQKIEFEENLDDGIHYIELHADRMPILHRVAFQVGYRETKPEERAAQLVKTHRATIKAAAQEFRVAPAVVGAVIYQEQATNVNFVDTLTDYIGGLLHLNTSIGIGQVRINTAQELEDIYHELKPETNLSLPTDDTFVRVERLKDPYTNIRYVAAKLRFSQERWGRKEFDISDKPEILGTLYNIEDVANPIEPHANPQTNDFGAGVKKNYEKVRRLLGL